MIAHELRLNDLLACANTDYEPLPSSDASNNGSTFAGTELPAELTTEAAREPVTGDDHATVTSNAPRSGGFPGDGAPGMDTRVTSGWCCCCGDRGRVFSPPTEAPSDEEEGDKDFEDEESAAEVGASEDGDDESSPPSIAVVAVVTMFVVLVAAAASSDPTPLMVHLASIVASFPAASAAVTVKT